MEKVSTEVYPSCGEEKSRVDLEQGNVNIVQREELKFIGEKGEFGHNIR